MLAKEFIVEYTDIADGITDHLKSLGYKLLGQGVDQQAWEEPSTGHVLKIFGTGSNDDHKMFYKWAKFCQKNSNNPYLPKFYGIEKFEFEGKPYIQFRQERLYKNNKFNRYFLEEILSYLEECFIDDISARFDNFVKLLKSDDLYSHYYKYLNDPRQVQQITEIFNTVVKLEKIAEKNNWQFDLHDGNIMMRSDTTPVITDPWVI